MKYFTIKELCRSNTADRLGIDNTAPPHVQAKLKALVENVLDPLREWYGKPIIVNSGYRNERVNKAVGGARYYGLSSNAALLAPCFVGTATQFINFRGTEYSLNFSQANVFLSNSAKGATVALPYKSQVARMFGMKELPSSDFGFTFTAVGVARSRQVTFLNILNNDGVLKNYKISGGDAMEVLCYTLSGNMYYQVLHYRT